jgi:hypothetical protein
MIHNGVAVRKIILLERVTEVNGVEMVQEETVQQIVEFMPDGSVNHGLPLPCHMDEDMPDQIADSAPATGVNSKLEGVQGAPQPEVMVTSFRAQMHNHLRHVPVWARFVLVFIHALTLTALTFVVFNVVLAVCRAAFNAFAGYKAVPSGDVDEKKAMKDVKTVKENEEALLPAYEKA